MPPKLAAQRAGSLMFRLVRRYGQRSHNEIFGTLLESAIGSFGKQTGIPIAAADIPPDLVTTLRLLVPEYQNHRFDLLGSDWVDVGLVSETRLGKADQKRAAALYALIPRSDYRRIDWQRDFRSGWRWSEAKHSSRLFGRHAASQAAGADVKIPWELARLQHLPQMSLAYILAHAGDKEFPVATQLTQEISSQILDFIAANPPNFGINWVCTMDVAIRAANIALTIAILYGAGYEFPRNIEAIIATSLHQHCSHIVENLEYSETGRSNHYIANIAGLVWCAWILEESIQRDQWLKFSITEIIHEADVQFLSDGGHYENSTSYHRLSGEMIVFSLALILSFEAKQLTRIDSVPRPRRRWRAPFPLYKGNIGQIESKLVTKIARFASLSFWSSGSDGMIAQIGDTDSGRFFKLHPFSLPQKYCKPGQVFCENNLNHTGFISSVAALFGDSPEPMTMDALLVAHLCGTRTLPISAIQQVPTIPWTTASRTAGSDAWGAVQKRLDALPADQQRVWRIPFITPVAPQSWYIKSFPDFGLYCLKHRDGSMILFRCLHKISDTAPTGHSHDDNLAVEFRVGGQEYRDPGSYLYTPAPELRQYYRCAESHYAPRIQGVSVTIPRSYLFDLPHRIFATLLCFDPQAIGAALADRKGVILRLLRVQENSLLIHDGVEGEGKLAPFATAIPRYSFGYGRRL